jgi:hypothetical protein
MLDTDREEPGDILLILLPARGEKISDLRGIGSRWLITFG